VIYHSHPNVGAYFSATDAKEAAPESGTGPLWPGVTYVVMSVRDRRVVEWAAFSWGPEQRAFVEVHRQAVSLEESRA
jgi:proteasome lid subunit RPN8/RPN11